MSLLEGFGPFLLLFERYPDSRSSSFALSWKNAVGIVVVLARTSLSIRMIFWCHNGERRRRRMP
jgi:hypothetical protein